MQSSDDLPKKELAVENFLVLEFLVSDTLNSSISCDQLALAFDFLAEILDVLAIQ